MENKAAFANITYPLSDKFRGTAGYRRTWDKVKSIELPEVWPNQGMDYSSPDYSLGVEYDLAENSMLYANYATSYRMWGQAVSRGGRIQPPEKLNAYTIGAKNRFMQNTLQLNAAAYYYYYENKRAQMTNDGNLTSGEVYEDELADPDGNRVDVNGNDEPGEHVLITGMMNLDPWYGQWGAFRTIGVDVSAEWVPTIKDRFTLGISYLNAEWSDLVTEYFWQRADGGHFFPTDGKSYNGYTNTYSPTWTITASYERNFELGSYGMLVPHVDAQYKSDYRMDFLPENYAITYQEPYFIYNGSITFTHSSGRWTLNTYVKNATNYAAKNFYGPMGGTSSLGISDPRTYGGVLSVKF
jgi:iron complex outermembrane recepter protein